LGSWASSGGNFDIPWRASTARTVRSLMPSASAIRTPEKRSSRSAQIASPTSAGVRPGIEWAIEDRSSSSRSPARHRANHSPARRSLMPAAAAAATSDQPCSSTRSHIKRLDAGHVLAF
jgi:hypothetical protein